MRRLVLVFLASLGATVSGEAGPWALGKGRTYARLSYQHLASEEYSAPDGTTFPIPTFRKDDVDLFLARGLTDRLTLVTALPLVRSSDLADRPDELMRETGFGDLRLGLELEAGRRAAWVFGVGGLVQAPTGDEARSFGLQATGSGAWEAEAWLSAGRSWGRLFGKVSLGYGYRGGVLRDGVAYAAQVGWTAHPRLLLLASMGGLEPLSHDAGGRPAGSSYVGAGDRVTYLKYGLSAALTLGSGWGVQVDLEDAVRTRNLARGTVLRIGPYFRR